MTMASMSMLVTDYRCSARQGPDWDVQHILWLYGVSDNGGKDMSAYITFSSPPSQDRPASTTTDPKLYPGYPVSDDHIMGVLPDSAFASWYELLRSERPIRLAWALSARTLPDPGTGNSLALLEYLSLHTGKEPPGEGPGERSLRPAEQEDQRSPTR